LNVVTILQQDFASSNVTDYRFMK